MQEAGLEAGHKICQVGLAKGGPHRLVAVLGEGVQVVAQRPGEQNRVLATGVYVSAKG